MAVANGSSVAEAFDAAAAATTDPVIAKAVAFVKDPENLKKSMYDFTIAYGTMLMGEGKGVYALGCMNPHAFGVSLHAILNAASYEDGVLANTKLSGDSCGRGVFVGAVLGAAFGVPDALAAKLHRLDEKKAAIDACMG